ncbi:MAG: radical SAM protein [Spirochaetaceae bacterium]|jgi:lysine 2,3-aminomutase|nr:radical SAM protein [Spirochaetaceae bacterium]
MTGELEARYLELAARERLLPVKITPFYRTQLNEEIKAIGIGGPLYRTVLPTEERLSLHVDGETADYINEVSHAPPAAPYIIRKYPDRVAFIITERCFAHCQYCFRAYKLSDEKKSTPLEEKLAALTSFLSLHNEIEEVVITGGDPLILSDENLETTFKSLVRWKLRLHTRAPVYHPERITPALSALLNQHHVKLVLHINHPYELCEPVCNALSLLHNQGVLLFAQYPLLRGINDQFAVQKELLEQLTELHIRPLSIFIVEPNKYSASFRLCMRRIEEIIDMLQWQTPSWINSVRFVLDTEIGKVRRENIVMRTNREIVFRREGKETRYLDFPAELDIPGKLPVLLWKTP